MIYLAVFASMYVFVALKALQQLQVCNYQFMPILPTSYGLAACELFLVSNMAREGWGVWLWLALGSGAGLGALTTMYLHKRRFGKK